MNFTSVILPTWYQYDAPSVINPTHSCLIGCDIPSGHGFNVCFVPILKEVKLAISLSFFGSLWHTSLQVMHFCANLMYTKALLWTLIVMATDPGAWMARFLHKGCWYSYVAQYGVTIGPSDHEYADKFCKTAHLWSSDSTKAAIYWWCRNSPCPFN